jgi:hypothetical protein
MGFDIDFGPGLEVVQEKEEEEEKISEKNADVGVKGGQVPTFGQASIVDFAAAKHLSFSYYSHAAESIHFYYSKNERISL